MIKFRDSKIFVGAVNAPSFGQWFGLPVSPRQVNQVLTNKGVIGPGIDNEELLISDYEAPFKIDPYDSIDKLNNMIESANRAIEKGIDDQTLNGLINQGLISVDHTIDTQVENVVIIKAGDEDDLANKVINMLGGVSQLSEEDLAYYFDFKKYGHDLILGGKYMQLPHGNYVGQ